MSGCSSTKSSATTNLMDEIQRRSAHAHCHHNPEENARVAIAAWSFVVLTSVTVAWLLQKQAEFRAS